MPRRNSAVKNKSHSAFNSLGVIDLHFHGAFGIDLMSPTVGPKELNRLSQKLWENGVAAFCPTTLSLPPRELLAAVTRLGQWIQSRSAPGALPLGIHLEGPFIHPHACGAHPPASIRPFSFPELERLWEASLHTLKILTLAPERISPADLRKLGQWARARKVVLSLGHSHATEAEADQAFRTGFRGITHAWNAAGFHHRTPGPLGAAIGRKGVYLELIIDQVHVAPTLIRWTRALHAPADLCFVSDCVPATRTPRGSWHSFGPLQIRFEGGASRLGSGALAGGGLLLPESFARWVQTEARRQGLPAQRLARQAIVHLTAAPLKALGIPASRLRNRQVRWTVATSGKIQVNPVDSQLRSR